MDYRESFIKYINSDAVEPGSFDSLRDYKEYCNITCIVSFDFLDMELTDSICRKKWNQYLENMRFICYE